MAKDDIEKLIKKVPGRIKNSKVTMYKGCPVYLRQIDKDIFEYLCVFENQIYGDYIIMMPEEGKKSLTQKQVNGSLGLVFTGATTTIDELFRMKEEQLLSNSVPSAKTKGKRSIN